MNTADCDIQPVGYTASNQLTSGIVPHADTVVQYSTICVNAVTAKFIPGS